MGFRLAEAFVSVEAEDNTDEGTSKIGSSLTKWAAGLGIGAVISEGIMKNLDIEAGTDKLAAQMNLTGDAAAKAGAVAGEVYKQGWGDSIGGVNDTIKALGQNLVDVNSISQAELGKLTTKAQTLADVFQVDVGEASKAAGQLVKNGLAKDSTEAFDIITRGYQNGLDASGDFLDTLTEYSPQFNKLGIDGPHALALLGAGLKAGAKDTDVIADAFKEFSLRAIDGSKTTMQAYKDIGLNGKQMTADIAAGGPKAEAATNKVIQSLLKIKDPVKQNAAGTALFGTQWEDTLRQILPAMDMTKLKIDDVAGATDQMGQTASDNAQAKIDVMKRSMEGWLTSATNMPGPLGSVAQAAGALGPQGLVAIGAVTQMGGAFGGLIGKIGPAVTAVVSGGAKMVASAVATTASTIAQMVVQGAKWVWLGIQAMASAIRIAAAWLISLGPIALVIAAVIALVAFIVTHMDLIKKWISAAWEWIKSTTATVWNAIKSFFSAVWSAIVTVVKTYINAYKTVIVTVFNWVKTFFVTIFNAYKTVVTTVFNAIKSTITNIINGIKTVISTVLNTIKTLWSNGWNAVKNFVTTAWNNIKTGVTNGITKLISVVKGIPSKITGALGNLGNLLLGKGKQIVQGLWSGISGMGGWLKDKIMGWAKDVIPGPIAKALGINSPSRVAADLAEQVPAGVAVGMDRGRGMVTSAAERLAGDALPAFGTSRFNTSNDMNSAGMTSGGGRSVRVENLNVNISGTWDFADPMTARNIASKVRDEIVKLERETR